MASKLVCVELLNSELVYEVLGMLCKRFEELDVATILTLLQCENFVFSSLICDLLSSYLFLLLLGAYLCMILLVSRVQSTGRCIQVQGHDLLFPQDVSLLKK
jgi:hypothetical protein